jgi:hypothetical protein
MSFAVAPAFASVVMVAESSGFSWLFATQRGEQKRTEFGLQSAPQTSQAFTTITDMIQKMDTIDSTDEHATHERV